MTVDNKPNELMTINGLIPFKLLGDLESFEKEYLPYFEELHGEDGSRNIISSIWLFANEQWSRGFEQGKTNPDFTD